MTADLNDRAREAARAVRASVMAVEMGALSDRRRGPERGRGPWASPVARRGSIVLAGCAALIVGFVAFALASGGGEVNLSTQPTSQPTSATTATSAASPSAASPVTSSPGPIALPQVGGSGDGRPSPAPPPPAGLALRTVIHQARTSDGRAWTLSVEGPSEDICLFVGVSDGRSTALPQVCAGRPSGQPVPAQDRPVPLVSKDGSGPQLVFGRLPGGSATVEVVLADGTTTVRQPVIVGTGGPFFVVEVPKDAKPAAVVAYLEDGRTERHAVPA